MVLAHPHVTFGRPDDGSPQDTPLVLNPAEWRQLRQCYEELLELHHAEVVEDEDFEDAHRLLVEQVLPLRAILRDRLHTVVDPAAGLTF